MIKSQITLKQLEAFVCVVDMGSFRKAAKVLATTQPNISNRIASLEASLGIVLMHRDAGSVRLTERGETLLADARRALWAAEAFLETAGRQDLIADRMRLGVTELVACVWLHDFLRALRETYPAVAVELEVDLSVEIEKAHVAGQIDLALQTGPFQHGGFASVPLGTYPYVWVGAPDLCRAVGHAPDITRLAQSPLLIHARHSQAARELARLVETRHLAVHQMAHSSSLTSCVQMAVDGMGIALLPELLVREALAAGRLRRIDCDWHPKPLEFFARFDRDRVPRFVEAAARLAVEVAARHV